MAPQVDRVLAAGTITVRTMCKYSVNCHRPYVQSVAKFSVIRTILFIKYTADLISDIESHGLSPDRYADIVMSVVSAALPQSIIF